MTDFRELPPFFFEISFHFIVHPCKFHTLNGLNDDCSVHHAIYHQKHQKLDSVEFSSSVFYCFHFLRVEIFWNNFITLSLLACNGEQNAISATTIRQEFEFVDCSLCLRVAIARAKARLSCPAFRFAHDLPVNSSNALAKTTVFLFTVFDRNWPIYQINLLSFIPIWCSCPTSFKHT